MHVSRLGDGGPAASQVMEEGEMVRGQHPTVLVQRRNDRRTALAKTRHAKGDATRSDKKPTIWEN